MSYWFFNRRNEERQNECNCNYGCIKRYSYHQNKQTLAYLPVTAFVSSVNNRIRFSRTIVERVDFPFWSLKSFRNAMSTTDQMEQDGYYNTPEKS